MLLDIDVDGSAVASLQAAPDKFLRIMRQSLDIRSHSDLLSWLQGGFQALLPHEILLVAWGDPSLDAFHIDLTSSLDHVRTQGLTQAAIQPFVRALFEGWAAARFVPSRIAVERDGTGAFTLRGVPLPSGFGGMRHAVVHGIRNQRDHQACLYALLGRDGFPASWPRDLEILLPCIDAALRQIDHLPAQRAGTQGERVAAEPGEGELPLSDRESDIVRWVAAGKTNEEIGLVMNISPFTVKNHLRRIFQKLDVTNRAQAVDRIVRHREASARRMQRRG